MEKVYLSIGSNRPAACSGRKKLLLKAEALVLDRIGSPVRISSFYESDPWELKDPVSFYNAVICVTTVLSPEGVLEKIREIEGILGRKRESAIKSGRRKGVKIRAYAPRTMDIDILFFGSKKISNAELEIPHPLLHRRMFVLVPLAEIASDFMHPSLGKKIQDLLSSCPDKGKVRKLPLRP